MRLIDLSVSIADNLPVDPDLQIAHINYVKHGSELSIGSTLSCIPGIKREDLKEGYGWAVDLLTLGSHTGTHMDAPYHYHPTMNNGEEAWTIDQVPLDWCIGNGVVFDFSEKPDGYVCTPDDLSDYLERIGYELSAGDIVLIHTNAMSCWGSAEYMTKGCGIGRDATLWLAEKGIHVAGTDAWSWDAPLPLIAEKFKEDHDKSKIWEGHKAGAECVFCHMEKLNNLGQLPPFGFTVIAFPVKIEHGTAGWVRPVALITEA